MLLKIILSYLTGYIKLEITGYYIERLINLCNSQKIAIWNIKRDKNVTITLNTTKQEFKKIIKIAKKTQCKVKIKNKKGIPFLLHQYKKRKIFLVLLVVMIFLIISSSNFVWNIEIKEENGQQIENIEQDLEEAGLKIGELRNKIDSKEIINKIRLKRQDIAWIGIELKGTNAIVKIVKSNEKPEIIDENEYCNIISDKEGVITKITAQNGTPQVEVGDVVRKDSLLIAGWLEGKYTGIRYVHAKGEIEAKIWHTKSKKIYYNTTIEEETGEVENLYSIKIKKFKINLNKGVSKFEFYDTINEEKKFKIFSDFYIPISIEKTTNKELKKVEKRYSIEEAKNIGIKELEEELDNEIEDKTKIVGKTINTYENEEYVEVYVTYEVLENIGTNEKIVF